MKRQYFYLLISVLAIMLPSCMKYEKPTTDTATSGTTSMMCDDSFRNIMEQEIDVFEYQYPEAHILAQYTPEREAIDSLLALKTKTIVIPRDLTKEEVQYLKSKQRLAKSKMIAVDAIALIVNPENPCDILTESEISEILTGRLKQWNDISPNKLGEIKVVFDSKFASTVQYMRDSLMNGGDFGDNVYAQDSVMGVFEAVKKNPSAIGVIGVSWLTTDLDGRDQTIEERTAELNSDNPTIGTNLDASQVKVLKVCRDNDYKAYKPYQQNIYEGTYPLFRQIYMITVGANGGLAHGFYSFVTGVIGQKIILKTGIMPAVIHPQVVNVGGKD